MELVPRHQCLLYEGAPSKQLPALAAATREKLKQNYRCLYLNSRPMVAGFRSYLAALDVDVAHEIAKASLVLSSDQRHLTDRHFDVHRMMDTLEDALAQALRDGYAGLWATGDMSWEMGPDQDFSRLLDYEWRLEEFFRNHPQMGGICQYHADTLPGEVMRHGLIAHPSLFISETLARMNPHYVPRASFTDSALRNSELDSVIRRLFQPASAS